MVGQVHSEFEAARNITHPGENGRAKETILINFFRKIVPAGFGVGSGFVIDTNGKQSKQQDVIIYHASYHPRFEIGGINFFPVESVALVIEVKTMLDSEQFGSALMNGASVKELDRTANGRNYLVPPARANIIAPISVTIAHRPVDPLEHHDQIFSMIVALESAHQDTLIPVLLSHMRQTPRTAWPNLVTVHGKWSLAYNQAPGVDEPRTNPMLATSLRFADKNFSNNVDPLIDAVEQVWSFLRVASLIDVMPNRYVDGSCYSNKDYSFLEQ
jgi:hypothetical protein